MKKARKKLDFLPNKLNKYSIRKFTVGTASILVGATLIFGARQDVAKASEEDASSQSNTSQNATSQENSTQETNDSADQSSTEKKSNK